MTTNRMLRNIGSLVLLTASSLSFPERKLSIIYTISPPGARHGSSAAPMPSRSRGSAGRGSGSELWRELKPQFQVPKAIIFDKDGTLIDFHSVWTPWVLSITRR